MENMVEEVGVTLDEEKVAFDCAEKDRSVSLSSWRDYNDGMKCVCVRIK